jgi:hypothetical protein
LLKSDLLPPLESQAIRACPRFAFGELALIARAGMIANHVP